MSTSTTDQLANRPTPRIPPPAEFIQLTTMHRTIINLRKSELAGYGEAPDGYEGNTFIFLTGNETAYYVLETVDEITAML